MITITKEIVNVAKNNFLTLEELLFILTEFLQLDWEITLSPASKNKLSRMGLFEGKLLTQGESLAVECLGNQKPATPKQDNSFEEFWLLYPKDDGFRSYPKTRLLRWNKAETKRLYESCLDECTHHQLMKALTTEIAWRQQSDKENLFKYMKSSVNYLKDKSFLNFIDEEIIEQQDQYGKELG